MSRIAATTRLRQLPPQRQPTADPPNVQGLLDRHQGNAMGVIATLLSENHGYRERNRQLQAQLPAQGAVVLTHRAGHSLDGLPGAGRARRADDPDPGRTDRTGRAGQAPARATRSARPPRSPATRRAVLGQLPGADKLTFEIREVEQNGAKVKTVVVKDPGTAEAGGATETPLADHATNQWADFLPALQQTAQGGQPGQRPAARPSPARTSGGGQPANTVDAYAQQHAGSSATPPQPLRPETRHPAGLTHDRPPHGGGIRGSPHTRRHSLGSYELQHPEPRARGRGRSRAWSA